MAEDNNKPLDLVDPRIAEFKLSNNLIKIKSCLDTLHGVSTDQNIFIS